MFSSTHLMKLSQKKSAILNHQEKNFLWTSKSDWLIDFSTNKNSFFTKKNLARKIIILKKTIGKLSFSQSRSLEKIQNFFKDQEWSNHL